MEYMEIGDGENMSKTKLMIFGLKLDVLETFGKYPCVVCQVENSGMLFSVVVLDCDIKGFFTPDLDFR